MYYYKMKVAYDGTNYNGWQRQTTNPNTVQGIIEEKLSMLLEEPVKIAGAGRTDGGVHAQGQSAGFRSYRKEDCGYLMSELNAQLSDDIRIYGLEPASPSFHCRKSAKWKQYCYRIDCRDKPDVFTRRYTYHVGQSVDIVAMEQAASLLVGTHDFRSFTSDKNSEKDMERTIYKIELIPIKDEVQLHFYGDGFLYHMVRILSGTLLEVGLGQRDYRDIPSIFAAKERSRAGILLPGKGLTLVQVGYEPF